MCPFKCTFLHLKGGKLQKKVSWLEPNLVIFPKSSYQKRKRKSTSEQEKSALLRTKGFDINALSFYGSKMILDRPNHFG